MPRDLFDDVTHPSVRVGSRAWYVLPLSILAHGVIGAIVIVVPLMATDVLPRPSSVLTLVVAPPPPTPDPPPPPADRQRQLTPAPTAVRADVAPTEAPASIEPEPPGIPALPSTAPGVVGVSGGVPGGDVGSVLRHVPEPPPPVSHEPRRTGGVIKNPAKTRHVRPVYPAIAVANRVQGTVIIETIIGVDGRVKEAKVLRSIPLLDQAALDAVRQWQFTPTLLNGVPVPVIMTVTVNFTLG